MSLPDVFVVVALILALADELRSRGQSLTGWAVVFVCIALLWGVFP